MDTVFPWLPYLLPVAGYLLGSIPFGLLVGHWAGVGDVRRLGSGNIGATNLLRTAGKGAGAVTLLLDLGKGALPVLVAQYLLENSHPVVPLTGLATFAGHLWPLYLGFRGGKGVATGLGLFLAWTPLAGLAAVLTWLIAARLFRYSSLAALLAFALLPPAQLALYPGAAAATATLVALAIFWRHRDNIRRLMQGAEPRIGQKGDT